MKVALQFDFQVGSGNGAWGLVFPSIVFVPESRTSATPSNLQFIEALKRREWGIIMIIFMPYPLVYGKRPKPLCGGPRQAGNFPVGGEGQPPQGLFDAS